MAAWCTTPGNPHINPHKNPALLGMGLQRWSACIRLCTVSRPHSDCRACPNLHKIAEWPSARIPSRAYIGVDESSNAVSPGDGVTAGSALSISAPTIVNIEPHIRHSYRGCQLQHYEAFSASSPQSTPCRQLWLFDISRPSD